MQDLNVQIFAFVTTLCWGGGMVEDCTKCGMQNIIIPCCFYGNNAYREKDNTRVYNRSLKIYWIISGVACMMRYLRMNA